jgi:hypothetical protein
VDNLQQMNEKFCGGHIKIAYCEVKLKCHFHNNAKVWHSKKNCSPRLAPILETVLNVNLTYSWWILYRFVHLEHKISILKKIRWNKYITISTEQWSMSISPLLLFRKLYALILLSGYQSFASHNSAVCSLFQLSKLKLNFS